MFLKCTISVILITTLTTILSFVVFCGDPVKPDFINEDAKKIVVFSDSLCSDTVTSTTNFYQGDTIQLSVKSLFPQDVLKIIAQITDSESNLLFIDTASVNPIDSVFHLKKHVFTTVGEKLLTVTISLNFKEKVDSLYSLNVLGVAPRIINDLPIITDIIAGNTCILSVSASGTEPIVYKWMRNNDTINNSNTIPNVLTINNIQSEHKGKYRCVIRNAWGTISSSTTDLIVYPANTPSAPEKLKIVAKNSAWVMLGWNTVQPDSVMQYRIYRDIVPFGSSTPLAQTVKNQYVDKTSETFYYWVTAYNGTNESPRSNYVWSKDTSQNIDTLIPPPRWKVDSISIILNEGENYTLSLPDTCINPDTINPLNFKIFSSSPKGLLYDSLYSFSAGHLDSGIYRDYLVAGNGSKTTDTMVIKVTVHEKYQTLELLADIGGSAIAIPEKKQYRWADTVTIRAVADSGFTFNRWLGDIPEQDSTDTSIVIVIDEDKSIVATFTQGDLIIIHPPADLNKQIKSAVDMHRKQIQLWPLPGEYPEGTVKGKVLGTFKIKIENN